MIHQHATLRSTNDEAHRLATAGAAHGTAVQAIQQTAGRGRHGRRWVSPPGNLHVSIILRPPPERRSAELGFLAAIATADAVDAALAAPAATLKWPNDVLLHGAKIAGILIEADGTGAAIAGIGINIAHAPPDMPATALAQHGTADPHATLAALLTALDHWWTVWLDHGFDPIRAAWLRRGPHPGAPLVVTQAATRRAGRFAGLAEDGALLLDTDDDLRRVVVGDVT